MKTPLRPPRLRKLSDEEIELWTQVAATVTRRPDATLPSRYATPAAGGPQPQPPPPALTAKPGPSAKPPSPPPFAPLERTLRRKLSRGRMTADAALDLHGLRQEEAYGALRGFLVRSQGEGARVVLVVTGKGSRGSDAFGNAGVLRRAVPLWLTLPEFRAMVIGFEEAGRPHGGAGALYIRLRRRATLR